MATKTITELQAAATPILSTDLMIVSRDGYNLTKTTAAQLPVSSAVQTALDEKITGGYDSNGKLTGFKNKDGTEASVGDGSVAFSVDTLLIKQEYANLPLLELNHSACAVGWSTGADYTLTYDSVNGGLRIRGALGAAGSGKIDTIKTLDFSVDATKVNRVAIKFKSNTPGIPLGYYFRLGNASTFSAQIGATNYMQIAANDDPGWHWLVFNTAEDPTIEALGTITRLRLVTSTYAAPYLYDVTISQIVLNPQSVSHIAFTFDDAGSTQYTNALPYMQSQGIKGTLFVPGSNIDGVNRLTSANLASFRDAGWAICTNGTDDDSPITNQSTVELAVSKMLTSKYKIANAVGAIDSLDYICYPNGVAFATPTVNNVTATSNGTTTVTVTALTSAVAAGDAYYAANAPDGTIITASAASGATSITVSNTIPTGTVAASTVKYGVFTPSAFETRMRNCGVKAGRLTNTGDSSVIDGFTNPYKLYGFGFSGQSLNQAIQTIDLFIGRGVVLLPYIHSVVDDVGGWTANTTNPGINVYYSFFTGLIDYIKAKQSSGQIIISTFPSICKKFSW